MILERKCESCFGSNSGNGGGQNMTDKHQKLKPHELELDQDDGPEDPTREQ
jgi:hypothetical protein